MSEIVRGDRVATPFGPGVVVDHQTYAGECLVRLDTGSVMDTTHGRWLARDLVSVVGHDPDAMVYTATGRRVRAADTH